MGTVFTVILVLAILWPLKFVFKSIWCPRMARLNLLNYAFDHYPSTENTLYVNLEWRCEVINKGEMQE